MMNWLKYVLHYALLPLVWGSILGAFLVAGLNDNEFQIAAFIGIIVEVAVFNTLAQLFVSIFKLRHLSRWFLASGIALLGLYIVFKIMHWPGATFQMILGSVLILLFVVSLFWKKVKKEDD